MQRECYGATKSTSFALGEGPANALALSKDNSHVVVAGRNVFKILSIDEEAFIEKVNLRVGKNLNLNYSCNDVVWSHLDENLIATGATNGAVVLWNLSKNTRAKQEHVFADHQRTVHRVVFHPTDSNMLLSGSQDGTVKCFDLRAKEAKLTFKSNSESVRDVQFVPKNCFSVTSVSENGSVQLWDIRKGGERPLLTFTAHSGPVFSCDWHPDSPSVLATGGRDRAIKVWTITNVATLEHTIQTVASVGRIKWRPQRKNHIGSTSLVVDASVCVWDVRRPFVPFAAFEKHKDVATGIAWKNSPHVFLSTSKDCTVWQHIFGDATRPATKAIPQALALNIRHGEIAQAVTTYRTDSSSETLRFPLFNRKTATADEQFHMAQSHFFTYEAGKLVRDGFRVECAENYILWGKGAGEMCERNARVASSLNLAPKNSPAPADASQPEVSAPGTTSECETSNMKFQYHPIILAMSQICTFSHLRRLVALVWEIAKLFCMSLTADVSMNCSKNLDQVPTPPKDDCREDHNVSDEEVNNNSSSETEKHDLLAEIASGLHISQNLFMTSGPTYDFQVQKDWQILPAEAFQLRHEIREGSSPPIHLEDCSPRDVEETVETVAIENRTSQLKISRIDPVPDFDLSAHLMKALHYHAKQGDVQTAICVWLVLSSVHKLPVDRLVLESWCLGYVELLQRNRLYAQAALVIKRCGVLSHLSQQSTSYLICCGQCGKPLTQKSGNYCEKCRKTVARCGICHGAVSGLMSWCQGCGHGGHVVHLRWWFSKHKECPVGCGHLCHT